MIKPIEYATPTDSGIIYDNGRYTAYRMNVTKAPVIANRNTSPLCFFFT